MANTSASLANTYRTYYEKQLLQHAVKKLEFAQYGKPGQLLPKSGGKVIRYFRRVEASLTGTGAPAALTEGTPPANSRDISYVPVDIPLGQRGQTSTTTDVADATGLLNFINDSISLLGEECALDADTIVRNQLHDLATGLQRRYAQGLADFAAVAAATDSAGRLTPRDVLAASKQLFINRAPKINGVYVCLVSPEVAYDILNNAEWREVIRQNYAEKYFKGEIGDLLGTRIVEHNNAFVEKSDGAEGTYVDPEAGGNIFSTVVLGAEAFGVPDMKKLGGSPSKPTVIINNKPDKSDPLNQKTIVGWKSYWGSAVLNKKYGQIIRSRTEFKRSAA